MKKIFCLILAFLMIFTVSCSKNNQGDQGSSSGNSKPIVPGTVDTPIITPAKGVLNSDANHYWEVKETNGYLLKNGVSEYSLLVPDTYGLDMETAINEFNLFFSDATGIKLPVVKSSSYNANGKYISLGKTKLLEENNLVAEAKLKGDGFHIKTVGDDLLLYGNSDVSALYAVYDLMSHLFDYDYIVDGYVIAKGVKEVPLMDYNVTEIPDIDNRAANYQIITAEKENSYRARMKSIYEYLATIGGLAFHNSFTCLPLEKYYAEHPKWYSPSKLNLSYCAQGDEEEYKLMVAEVAKIFKEELKAQPDRKYIALTVQDELEFDSSDAQKEIAKKYGANSASIILFMNDVNKIIREWFESDEGKEYYRELTIIFFAYNFAEEPPVSWNEEKQCYEGNEGIKCDDGVGVFWAPINADYLHSMYDTCNKSYYDIGKKWKSISNEMVLWTYNVNFTYLFAPFNTFNSLQDQMRFAKEMGASLYFNESENGGESLPSNFRVLKTYLEQRLMWNTELNVAELTEKFFRNYYGEMAEEMKEVFNSYLAYTTYLKDHRNDYDGIFSHHNEVMKEDVFPKQLLLSWYNSFTEIIEDAKELYATDKLKYDRLYKRVSLERLMPLYLLIEIHSNSIDDDTLLYYKKLFKADHYNIGGTRIYANGTLNVCSVEVKFDQWGI